MNLPFLLCFCVYLEGLFNGGFFSLPVWGGLYLEELLHGGDYFRNFTVVSLHRRKISTHALQKMTRDRFRVMSLAPRQKYPRNVVERKEAMAAFYGSDSVEISCHCKTSKIYLVKVLTEVCSLENIASWNWRKIAVAWSDSVLLTLRSLVCMWKTCRKGG